MTTNVWETIISPGEEIKLEFSLGKRYIDFIRYPWLSLGILLLVLSGILRHPLFLIFGLSLGLIFIIFGLFSSWYLKRANNYALTNRRILILRGWLSTNLVSIDYDKITDIRVEQKFLDKLALQTGSLIIDTAGTGFEEVILNNIENPYEIKKKLDEIREKIV